jgi:hypothetical protein
MENIGFNFLEKKFADKSQKKATRRDMEWLFHG